MRAGPGERCRGLGPRACCVGLCFIQCKTVGPNEGALGVSWPIHCCTKQAKQWQRGAWASNECPLPGSSVIARGMAVQRVAAACAAEWICGMPGSSAKPNAQRPLTAQTPRPALRLAGSTFRSRCQT